MFGRKNAKEKDVLQYDYYIKLNEGRIRAWLETEDEIGLDDKWAQDDVGVSAHIISFLPKAQVHYHKTPGVFSESVSGSYRTRDGIDIEWGIYGDYFLVSASVEDKLLFCCPVNRASQLLATGENGSSRLPSESNVISVDEALNTSARCNKVLEETWDTYSLKYSNNLVAVTFETSPRNQTVYYDSYT